MFDMSRETDVSLQLYSRKVMIMSKANSILPKWLRFVKGISFLTVNFIPIKTIKLLYDCVPVHSLYCSATQLRCEKRQDIGRKRNMKCK